MAWRREWQWPRDLSTRKIAQALAPLLGIVFLVNEFLIRSLEPRAIVVLAAFALLGLPFSLAADKPKDPL
jgi:hypothetical protein